MQLPVPLGVTERSWDRWCRSGTQDRILLFSPSLQYVVIDLHCRDCCRVATKSVNHTEMSDLSIARLLLAPKATLLDRCRKVGSRAVQDPHQVTRC
jgi:hypothetical protein